MSADRVSELKFGDDNVAIAPDDAVVMAVPPRPAASLLAGPENAVEIPRHRQRAFPLRSAPGMPPILGVVGGLVEWLFAFPQRLSITISNADRLVDMPREELAQAIWRDICKAAGVQGELPPWQIVRERRATFEATPEQNALRPGAVDAPGKTCFSPATGLIRGCRPPLRDRCGRATAPPIWSSPCGRPDRGLSAPFPIEPDRGRYRDVEQDAFRHEHGWR